LGDGEEWDGVHVACKRRKGIAYTVLVRQPKRKKATWKTSA